MNTEQVVVEGKDYTRTVWFIAGPQATEHPLCVFLDGEYYLERVGALPILQELIASQRIPQMSFAFVPSNGPQSRHEDFVCNDRFARFISEDLVHWARNRASTIRGERNLVCGLSLSGLASAHMTLTHPHVFSSALSQSGSFWWERKRFASLARAFPKISSRHWLSVGDQELEDNATHPPTGMRQEFTQVAGVQSAVDALIASGAEVRHHVFHGAHAFEPWRAELADALPWLCSA
ncbi:alpha/beta hydrolase-fold protein [Polyangium sp. y55x31]|uniref:alpha/beta hydrolase n=1 Tax=Polyangium sp. y55x31 TaxID=3042688 RepID=UPI00248325D9|nr:alpha/beta hydrolase-fold protein [Polyangium sp. y55x31]MDI1475964.1 alpha/beta hydrolase-fold protein [Polyangium sp. y55x31]